MGTPVNEHEESQFHNVPITRQRSSDDDHTVVGDDAHSRMAPDSRGRDRSDTHLTVDIPNGLDKESAKSPSQTREEAHRLDDDLALLQIERQVSQEAHEDLQRGNSQSRSMHRSRTRRSDPVDEFDVATNPLHEKAAVYKPPENPNTNLGKIFKKIHNSTFLVRYFMYIAPVVLIILIPLLLGFFLFPNAVVGKVEMKWFCIWLEIVWLTLWAGRVSQLFISFTPYKMRCLWCFLE
jgi:hypothetical protein